MTWFILKQIRNWYVAVGLPYFLFFKIRKALVEEGRSPLWRVGRVSFFMGILVFSPYAFWTRILNHHLSIIPVLQVHAVFLYSGLIMQRIANKRAAAAVQPDSGL
jgi:hypothetical protein